MSAARAACRPGKPARRRRPRAGCRCPSAATRRYWCASPRSAVARRGPVRGASAASTSSASAPVTTVTRAIERRARCARRRRPAVRHSSPPASCAAGPNRLPPPAASTIACAVRIHLAASLSEDPRGASIRLRGRAGRRASPRGDDLRDHCHRHPSRALVAPKASPIGAFSRPSAASLTPAARRPASRWGRRLRAPRTPT